MKYSNNYGLISHFYDPLANMVFGRSLVQAAANPFLELETEGKNILIPGIGTGSFLSLIPKSRLVEPELILGIDDSENMLSRASRKVNELGIQDMISLKRSDFFDLRPSMKFDLLLANFFLDCLPNRQIEEFMLKAYQSTAADGRLVITDFSLNESRHMMKEKALIHVAYAFFKISTNIPRLSLPDLDQYVDKGLWKIEEEWKYLNGFIRSIVLVKRGNNTLKTSL